MFLEESHAQNQLLAPDSSGGMGEVQDAIRALENLGLTEYEARCFVALAQLPHGTAKEIVGVVDRAASCAGALRCPARPQTSS